MFRYLVARLLIAADDIAGNLRVDQAGYGYTHYMTRGFNVGFNVFKWLADLAALALLLWIVFQPSKKTEGQPGP